MSARKTGSFDSRSSFPGFQTHLSLRSDRVRVCKSGIEFHTSQPLAAWTEMTVELASSREPFKVDCTGIVVACAPSPEGGYTVSMVLNGLSRQSQSLLNSLSQSRLD